jgi:hypothetical protein
MRWLAPATFALLVVASLITMVGTQIVRRQGLVVDVRTVTAAFTPNGDGLGDRAKVAFDIGRSQRVTVVIVDRKSRRIRTILDDAAVDENERVILLWDGLTDEGRPALQARYRVRFELLGQDRDVVPPERILLLRTPPVQEAEEP